MAAVGVIGAGVMGTGIAQVAAAAGWSVRLHDVDAQIAAKAIERLCGQLDRLVEKGRMRGAERGAILERIRVSAPADFRDCELVVEAVIEDMSVKVQAFGAAASSCPDAILATNTSSLSVTKLGAAIGRPRQTVGMHFFNPVPLMPLVEVISGEESAADAVDRVFNIATAWGKTPVRAQDTPGFIVNRVARGYYLEPLRMLGEGVSGVDEIDAVMKSLGGFRMGPFELMDLIGIDVNFGVSCSVWEQFGRPARLAPHPIQKRLVEQGRLGRKTKLGFYSYQPEHPYPAEPVERRTFELPEEVYKAVRVFFESATEQPASATEQYIFSRTLCAILNEAALALDDGVASRSDIDTAMRLGTNYPHGPIEWAERIGRRTCRHLLERLNEQAGDGRFAPAAWMNA